MKLVLFDFDGTLYDSQHLIVESVQKTAEKLDVAVPTHQQVLRGIGAPLPQALSVVFPNLEGDLKETFIAEYRRLSDELRLSHQKTELFFDGAVELIEELYQQDEILMGIVTSMGRAGLTKSLERTDLATRFVTSQTPDDGPAKPRPDPIFKAMEEAGGLAAADTMMIGDSRYDIEAGVNAGVTTIGVSWGYHGVEDLQQAGADYLVHSFPELQSCIENIWRKAA